MLLYVLLYIVFLRIQNSSTKDFLLQDFTIILNSTIYAMIPAVFVHNR